MKKLLILTFAILLSLSSFGRLREKNENPAIIDARITSAILDELRDLGYTVLPEVIVQDTLNHKKQRFSSRYETKGGRGYLLPDWANDSTWSPGQKPPKEWDDLYYQPSKDGKMMTHQKRQNIDAIVDTLVKENPEIVVNNHYNDDPFFYSNRIGRFYHGGFNYWYYSNPYFYNPWFYDDFYFGWDYPYFGYNNYWNYPYFGHNNFYFGYNSYWGWNFGWNWYRPYYHNNYWYGGHNNYYSHNSFNQQPQYGRRERPSNMSNTYNRRIAETQPQKNRIEATQQRTNPQSRPTYSEGRRSYTPSYETPRMGTRPAFNNSKTNDLGRNYERRTEISTESRTQTRTITQPNIQRSRESRTYSAPSRNYVQPSQQRSYNSGSSNFNSGADRRSSGVNMSSGSFNGGSSGAGRSSSGSSGSSGGSSGSSSSSRSSSGRR